MRAAIEVYQPSTAGKPAPLSRSELYMPSGPALMTFGMMSYDCLASFTPAWVTPP